MTVETRPVRIVGATLDEITFDIIGGVHDGDRVYLELPPGALLPPNPTPGRVAEAFLEAQEVVE